MEHSALTLPPPDALAVLPTPVIEAAIGHLIDVLDERDGDPDLEPNGDELDGNPAEDEFCQHDGHALPGCPVSDPAEDDDPGGGNITDEPHDREAEGGEEYAAWPERIDQTRFPGAVDSWRSPSQIHEDEEDDDRDSCLAADDDPRRRFSDGLPGDSADTEANGDEKDSNNAEDEVLFAGFGGGPGCAISDPGGCQAEDDSPPLRPARYGVDQSEGPIGAVWARPPRPEARSRRGADDGIGPDECPDVYASTCTGTCLEPRYKDGCLLVFSKSEPVKAGDFIGLWFQPGVAPPGQPNRWVKRLVMNIMPGTTFPYVSAPGSAIEPLVVVEMLNPPRRFTFRASQILAIHKVVGEAESSGEGMAQWRPDGGAGRRR